MLCFWRRTLNGFLKFYFSDQNLSYAQVSREWRQQHWPPAALAAWEEQLGDGAGAEVPADSSVPRTNWESRAGLCPGTDSDPTQVKICFQKRRSKYKKQALWSLLLPGYLEAPVRSSQSKAGLLTSPWWSRRWSWSTLSSWRISSPGRWRGAILQGNFLNKGFWGRMRLWHQYSLRILDIWTFHVESLRAREWSDCKTSDYYKGRHRTYFYS